MPSCTFIHLHMQIPLPGNFFLDFPHLAILTSALSISGSMPRPLFYTLTHHALFPIVSWACSSQGTCHTALQPSTALLFSANSKLLEVRACAFSLCIPSTFYCLRFSLASAAGAHRCPLVLTTLVQIFSVLTDTICIFAQVFSLASGGHLAALWQARSQCPSQEPSNNAKSELAYSHPSLDGKIEVCVQYWFAKFPSGMKFLVMELITCSSLTVGLPSLPTLICPLPY